MGDSSSLAKEKRAYSSALVRAFEAAAQNSADLGSGG